MDEETESQFKELRADLREQKKMVEVLREDLRFLIRHTLGAQSVILAKSNQKTDARFNAEEIRKCKEFVKKYDIRA